MDKFDLSKLPVAAPPADKPAMPENVQRQVQEVKATDARLFSAMETIKPERDNRLNTNVFEGNGLTVSLVKNVVGLNVSGKY